MNDPLLIFLLAAVLLCLLLIIILLLRKPHSAAPGNPPAELDSLLNARLNDLENHLYNRIDTVDRNMLGLQQLFRNVKLRGTWGEIQLGSVLSEFLNPSQYETNVAIDPESAERVEFAAKLPLPDNTFLWLPIDAKCPIEDFERLQQAAGQGNREEAEKAAGALKNRLLSEAADIAAKYIRPPYSTDFALMFLPIESLYQWALAQPELIPKMERAYRVIPCGPATISAVLNLVQLSHRSMAISQSESEVWQQLNTIKQETGKFADAIAKSQKKTSELSNSLDELATRLRVLTRRLNKIEELADSSEDSLPKQLD